MIFYLYVYMIAMALLTSAGCAYYTYRLGGLKTTFTGQWYLISAGFVLAVVYELYKLQFFLEVLNFLYSYDLRTLVVAQCIQTLKYVLPMLGFAIMYERRRRAEEP